jgi:hypothetical protein
MQTLACCTRARCPASAPLMPWLHCCARAARVADCWLPALRHRCCVTHCDVPLLPSSPCCPQVCTLTWTDTSPRGYTRGERSTWIWFLGHGDGTAAGSSGQNTEGFYMRATGIEMRESPAWCTPWSVCVDEHTCARPYDLRSCVSVTRKVFVQPCARGVAPQPRLLSFESTLPSLFCNLSLVILQASATTPATPPSGRSRKCCTTARTLRPWTTWSPPTTQTRPSARLRCRRTMMQRGAPCVARAPCARARPCRRLPSSIRRDAVSRWTGSACRGWAGRSTWATA